MWCDNLSAKALASNPVMHARFKHIEIDVHYHNVRIISVYSLSFFLSTMLLAIRMFVPAVSVVVKMIDAPLAARDFP
ncbi:transmembrane protein, putative [Medicago truncatula]|uniref:Transmembrane protein, putative n=1 Tax=Medicago truncatula TaxID=3880 RepID=A0A072TRB1_MEDTR|nr:transmembrane protein, putative [Medicago truncatula]